MYNNIRIFSINRFYDSNMLSWIVSQQAIEVIWLPPKRSFAHIHVDTYRLIYRLIRLTGFTHKIMPNLNKCYFLLTIPSHYTSLTSCSSFEFWVMKKPLDRINRYIYSTWGAHILCAPHVLLRNTRCMWPICQYHSTNADTLMQEVQWLNNNDIFVK